MNWPKKIRFVVFLLGLSMTQVAQAEWRGHSHGRHGGGLDIVIDPFGWASYPSPYYYPPPVYYPPPIYVSPPQQPVYIEQAPAKQAAPPPQSYWYYCTNPQGYYPTIKECPGGWLKVVPQTQPIP